MQMIIEKLRTEMHHSVSLTVLGETSMIQAEQELLATIHKRGLSSLLLKGKFGLEKENVRVDKHGKLALSGHPESFGQRETHPYIKTDFSESQIEMITPACETIEEAYDFLSNLQDIISIELEKRGEYLWTCSNPPIVPAEDKLIPIAHMMDPEEKEYRVRLGDKYGRKKQLMSGIHYNYSFSEELVRSLYKENGTELSYREFKDQLYLKLARNLTRHLGLLERIMGASPVFHDSFSEFCRENVIRIGEDSYYKLGIASVRNSKCGYRNLRDFTISYDSLSRYVEGLQELIETKELMNEKEYYNPIRLKAGKKGETLQQLLAGGIEYIELRLFDLNPFYKNGISKQMLYFIHAFNLYMLFLKEEPEVQKLGDEQLLLGMQNLYQDMELAWALDAAKWALANYQNPKESYAEQIIRAIKSDSYIMFHMKQSFAFLQESKVKSYQLAGYEDMELSTQILMKEAIAKGLEIEVLDRGENFIRLSDGDHTEYVKQATKTSLDSYSTVLIMENKLVTKEVLKRAGIRVPHGYAYESMEGAIKDYLKHCGSPIVIKPKNTNFGIGITIFTNEYDIEEYQRACEIAFQFDRTILIEEFIQGKEYRFLVLGNEVAGILRRVPANVKGDGYSTISELIERKNEDSLRGQGYRTPLEKIQMGEMEAMFLRQQGRDFSAIPADGEIIYLRENSNISTGGDSLDQTDEIPENYKEMAVRAAKAAGAVICGVDMMIGDTEAAIIELNFNPAIHIHCYPFKGENRQIGKKILDLLFKK